MMLCRFARNVEFLMHTNANIKCIQKRKSGQLIPSSRKISYFGVVFFEYLYLFANNVGSLIIMNRMRSPHRRLTIMKSTAHHKQFCQLC